MIQQEPKIFILDNEIEICNLFTDFFDFLGYKSQHETDASKFMDGLHKFDYDLLFLDLQLDGISGVDVLKKSKKIKPLSEVIVVTGYGTEETVLRTIQNGAFSFIQKPISFSEIKLQTEDALALGKFNRKTYDLLQVVSSTADEHHIQHLMTMINFDRLSYFLNMSIDIEMLADTVLAGLTGLFEADFCLFFFYDELNKEMVIHSRKPIPRNAMAFLENQIRDTYKKLTNVEPENIYNLRISRSSTASKNNLSIDYDSMKCDFVPILIENSIKGVIGIAVSGSEGESLHDNLHLVGNRVSHVLANATQHRNAKLLALTDGLTGLLNHRAFQDSLKNEFERFRRYGSPLSLILLDLDDLKKLNDSFGHPVGDRILKKIGEILRVTSRETDTLARYGGDEFVMLLPQTNVQNALNLAERLRKQIGETEFQIHEYDLKCSVTLGVASADETIVTPQVLLEKADNALYEAKRMGKNRVGIS